MLLILLACFSGMGYMLYDTIAHDNDTGMIIIAYVVTSIIGMIFIYVCAVAIIDFVRKERRRKTTRDLVKEMRELNGDPYYKGNHRYVNPIIDERLEKASHL